MRFSTTNLDVFASSVRDNTANSRRFSAWCCCCLCLMATRYASADYVGIEIEPKSDLAICQDASEPDIPFPLSVCNIYATFDDPIDRLLSVAYADITTTDPNGYYHHPLDNGNISPACNLIPLFPTLVCDSFVTIGVKCSDANDATSPDPSFDVNEFNNNGHVVGGWFNGNPPGGNGNAGNWPNLRVLILQLSVAQGESISGPVSLFMFIDGMVIEVPNQQIECLSEGCPEGEPCDDGQACTEDDTCDGDGNCVGTPVVCPEGEVCQEGECVPDSDPCECTDGTVTICHIPPGHLGNAHTITVGCRALEAHLQHGDHCGPCEGDGGSLMSGAYHDPCPSDLNGSGDIGPADLAELFGAWGPNPGHPADLDGNGNVGSSDLPLLLGVWGPCP